MRPWRSKVIVSNSALPILVSTSFALAFRSSSSEIDFLSAFSSPSLSESYFKLWMRIPKSQYLTPFLTSFLYYVFVVSDTLPCITGQGFVISFCMRFRQLVVLDIRLDLLDLDWPRLHLDLFGNFFMDKLQLECAVA